MATLAARRKRATRGKTCKRGTASGAFAIDTRNEFVSASLASEIIVQRQTTRARLALQHHRRIENEQCGTEVSLGQRAAMFPPIVASCLI